MTKSRHITPHEWIGDYFSPAVTVMACPEVEALCAKNNLTLTETLQPFAKLMTDVTLKDPEGVNHAVPSLHVIFQVSPNWAAVRSPGLLTDFSYSVSGFQEGSFAADQPEVDVRPSGQFDGGATSVKDL